MLILSHFRIQLGRLPNRTSVSEVGRGCMSGDGPAGADILVVEDDHLSAYFLQAILTRAGHSVRVAEDGEQALAFVQRSLPDLILLDVMMPNVSGFEVCKRLKAEQRTRHIPIIFISALDSVEDKVRAFDAGGVDYIIKPFQAQEVLARIHTHLALQALQERLQEQNERLRREIEERREVEQRLRRYAERFKLWHELDQSILAARSPETIAVVAVGRIRQLVPCQRVSVILNEAGEAKLLAAEAARDVPFWRDSTLYQSFFRNPALCDGRVIGVNDMDILPHLSPLQEALRRLGMRSYMVIPLSIEGELAGIISLESRAPAPFTAEHVMIATETASLLAIAIRQARLYTLAQQEIAERKQAELALRQRTAELEARNAELDAFAHTVAHDLKNPLAALLGFSALLKRPYTWTSEERIRRTVTNIAALTQKMANIVDGLLLLTSVRREEVELEPLDMGALIAEACERLEVLIKEHRAKIIIPSQWPTALGYALWVEEVWANYLSNAVKYGGRPEENVPPRVEVGAHPLSDREVRFWVRDNGRGLTPDEQAELFTPFTRIGQMRVEGHGLGLSIVRRIVERLGGRVGVESEIGKGSLFWFTLPAKRVP